MVGVEEISPWEEEIRENKTPTKMSVFFIRRQTVKLKYTTDTANSYFRKKDEKLPITKMTDLVVNNSTCQ